MKSKEEIEKEIIILKELANKWQITADRFKSEYKIDNRPELDHIAFLEAKILELEKYLKENYDS